MTKSKTKTSKKQVFENEVLISRISVVRTTDKAVLFNIDDEWVWLPRSQLLAFDHSSVRMSRWIAKEKKLV